MLPYNGVTPSGFDAAAGETTLSTEFSPRRIAERCVAATTRLLSGLCTDTCGILLTVNSRSLVATKSSASYGM